RSALLIFIKAKPLHRFFKLRGGYYLISRRITMRLKKLFTVAASAAVLTFTASAQAKEERTLCVWDIVGKSGDMYNIMKDFSSEAVSQGYEFRIRTYTDENIAGEDLKAGQCDAAAITGLRGRQFNSFTGSLDSMGSIPNDRVLRTVIQVLSSNNPNITEKMRSGSYEVYGDRKSTRLNSSHVSISYAVFCLKKKTNKI